MRIGGYWASYLFILVKERQVWEQSDVRQEKRDDSIDYAALSRSLAVPRFLLSSYPRRISDLGRDGRTVGATGGGG